MFKINKDIYIGDTGKSLNDLVTSINTLNTNVNTAFTGKSIKGRSAVGPSDWTDLASAQKLIPDMSFIAYWNGAYSGGSSNLAYCNKGAFGTIVTKNAGDYAAASHSHAYYPTTGGTINGNVVATGLMQCQFIELYASVPFIDFHFQNSSADYTARIAEWSSGNLTAHNKIVNSSDRRLKKDIVDLPEEYINILNDVKPRMYRFKKGDEYINIGFIAQEINEVLKKNGIEDNPFVQVGQDDDHLLSLDYNAFIPVVIKGYQDLLKKNKELEERISKLEK